MDEVAVHQFHTVSVRVAAVRAATFVALNGFTAETRADLEQELLLALWQKRTAFDSRRGCWRTFAEVVAAHKISSLGRKVHRLGRFQGESLDRINSIEAPRTQTELRADVDRVLSLMSPFDRRVADCLRAELSAAEASVELGVSRATVFRAIQRLRAAFIMAGFNRGYRAAGRFR